MNTQSNQMTTLIDTDTISSQQDSSANEHQQDTTVCSSFQSPQVTTTLDVCPIVKTPSTSCIRIVKKRNTLKRKSKSPVTIHLIGGWTIRESSQPFQRKENKPSSSIERVVANKPTLPFQWSVDEVCSYFECALGDDSYTSIIKEHLIDGMALLLLKDEHLNSIFKMQLESRLKLLYSIKKLKNGGLSAS